MIVIVLIFCVMFKYIKIFWFILIIIDFGNKSLNIILLLESLNIVVIFSILFVEIISIVRLLIDYNINIWIILK